MLLRRIPQGLLTNARIGAVTVMSALILLSPEAMPSETTIESTHPMYFAKVDGEQVISVEMPPRQLALDMNPENSVKSEAGGGYKPARYYFPHTHVPRSVLAHLEKIYTYNRRRDVPIVSSSGDWVIAEYYRANSHIPTSRFRLLGKMVQRQEQLDFAGRVTKIVLIGWAPRNSTEDQEQPSDVSVLGKHPAWIRVLRVSPSGKKTLIAAAWKVEPTLTSASADEAPKDRDLVFGVPNGTLRWRSMVDFARSQGVDLHAESLAGRYP